MNIDAHTHVVQEAWVSETWWQALSKVGAEALPGVTAEMVREAIIPALFDPDGSSQLGAMEAAGIDLAVMFPYDWSRAEQLGDAPSDWKEQNEWYRDFAARHPDRIRWGFGADPRQPGTLDAFNRAVKDDGAMCLKLHPAAGFQSRIPWSTSFWRVHET